MSTSSTTSNGSAQSTAGQPTVKQDALTNFCRSNGLRAPAWQVVSDRRGGRTAWSCTVQVAGAHIGARYWYDGQYVNNAREDAAEVALQRFGQQIPTPQSSPSTPQLQQQQRAAYGRPVGI
ncbi:hypothetical protein B0A50_02145 [Salinomyces thailandicus]|uniref:DRBM domain-containing protein n=1 Tax=Salinomyces thailandicus TaxID=706561 RepID=A0A4U0U7S0_9PEZI|nr:hypothetical protein B0A50_02145 [Salinomyces thailandica]